MIFSKLIKIGIILKQIIFIIFLTKNIKYSILCCCQRYRIFFTRISSQAIHSFKSENRVFYFFPKSYFWSEKKNKMYFFFPRKSSSAIHSDFEEPPIFLIKMCCVFFYLIFVRFFVFFSAEKFTCHSFIRFSRPEKKTTRKKKQLFHSFKKYPPKVRKNDLIQGKKNSTFAPK